MQIGDFREALAHLAAGVTVVTGKGGSGEPCGLTVTAACSYSDNPPSVLVSIAHRSRSHDALVRADRFAVPLLSSEQELVGRQLAGQAEDKFAGLGWRWEQGVPVIESALVILICARDAVFDHGDHSILIGQVLDARTQPGEPLGYVRRRMDWRVISPEDP